MILIRVDFPAPLSPARASTSPAWSRKETSLRAWTPPNRLETFSASSSGEDGDDGELLSIRSFPGNLFLNLVNENRNNDHHPDRHELPEWFNIHKNESVLNDRDDQGTNHRTDDGTGSPKQTGSADHD